MKRCIAAALTLAAACATPQTKHVPSVRTDTNPPTKIEPKSGLEFRLVAGGTFHFGCEPGDSQCGDDEKPGRTVAVKDLWLGTTEVTVDAFAKCVAAGACTPPGEDLLMCNWGRRGSHAMNCVDWTQASQFCAWIGGRLPSAEEWEFAAKGGESRIYPWGKEPVTGSRANFADKSCLDTLDRSQQEMWVNNGWLDIDQNDGFASTAPPGQYPEGRTVQGVADMAGNVWEWTDSDYEGGFNKELRGGGWLNDARGLRASFRSKYPPTTRMVGIGLRCAL